MNPPANWYPDPTGRHGQRYWDGEQWTEHVFTEGVQGLDPLDAAADGQDDEGSTDQATSGLFADAGDSGGDPAATTHTASGTDGAAAGDAIDESTWAPDEHTGPSGAADQQVAPEVEAEDVVGNLDEVADSTPNEDADAAVAVASDAAPTVDDGHVGDTAAPPGEGESAADEDPSPPPDDFSDAFMVTPETVSRLVSRQAADEPQEPDGTPPPSQEDARPAPAGAPTEASTAAPTQAAPMEAAQPATGGAIDAPPPTVPAGASAPASGGGLGISGDLVGGAFAERDEAGPVALQNARLLRCSLGQGPGVIARQGTMVAYQGEVSFERQGAGGVTRALKRAATGEGLAMMRAEGSGDVFFADGGQHVFLLHLDGGAGLSVNGRNVLAFSAALAWDIERVKGATLLAGGLFNTSLSGTGWVALVSDGEPVVLRTDEAPTYVDVNALVAWSGGLATRITSTVSAKSLVGLGSGEAFQMAFDGAGIVIVQPSEGPMGGAAAT